ncbi:MAG: hypothetical protein AB7T49_05045 [Oligoflexales bacterium]
MKILSALAFSFLSISSTSWASQNLNFTCAITSGQGKYLLTIYHNTGEVPENVNAVLTDVTRFPTKEVATQKVLYAIGTAPQGHIRGYGSEQTGNIWFQDWTIKYGVNTDRTAYWDDIEIEKKFLESFGVKLANERGLPIAKINVPCTLSWLNIAD